MIEDMTLRNLSRSTQQSYIYAVAKFSRQAHQGHHVVPTSGQDSTAPASDTLTHSVAEIDNYRLGSALFGLMATKSGSRNQQKIFPSMGVPIILGPQHSAFQGKGLDEKCC